MNRIITMSILSAITTTLTSCFFGKSKTVEPVANLQSTPSGFYTISIKKLDEKSSLDLSSFKGKKVLIVNTASKCGFTPQYKELQQLQDKYADKLVIIGTPCNQFGSQEPGTEEEIETFCQVNYGVTFPLTEKLDVKGSNQHALYQWLTQKSKNGSLDATVSWNFNKFLINENGYLIGYFPSTVTPLSEELQNAIRK